MLKVPRNGTKPQAEARPVTRDELTAMLALADTRQTAMILLGLNAAFDPVDFERLPLGTVDLKARVLHFDRTKADIEKPTPRICTLWPRTVRATSWPPPFPKAIPTSGGSTGNSSNLPTHTIVCLPGSGGRR